MSYAIDIQGLSKTFPNGFQALKKIDLKIESGDFFALLGPNGAGKSTTIGVISSLVQKTAGKVYICGIDVDQDFSLAKRQLGIVPQEFNFNLFETPESIVESQAGFYGYAYKDAKKRAEHHLKQLGLWEKRKAKSRVLSGGMKRRLMIARALVSDPKILILDEPTAGVDVELRRSMWDYLKEINAKGTTIILTTHYLEEAEQLCQNMAFIHKGEIALQTSIKELMSRLDQVTYVVDLAFPLPDHFQLQDYQSVATDAYHLEIQIPKNKYLNEVILQMHQAGLSISSIRPKTNRIEEIFINLTQ
jgi:ABC-2 type transport system ATP-binding protein